MRSVYVCVAAVSLMLLGSACSAQETDNPASAARAASSHPSTNAPDAHGGEHDEHGGDAEGHGGHQGSAALSAVLVDAADLPDGYREGHAHAAPTADAAPDVDAACAPIAELIGQHPDVRQDVHPQARTSFSKSHFGPEISETVIDYGSESAATEALDALRQAGEECDRYVQSLAPVGINSYAVEPGNVPPGDGEAVSLRLDAVGSDFDGLYMDLWATRVDDRVVAVGFLNARNGTNDDLHAAIPAVMSALDAQ